MIPGNHPKHICMIAMRHSLDDARVFHKEAQSLKNRGYRVSLIMRTDGEGRYLRPDGSLVAQSSATDGYVEHQGISVYGLPRKKGPFKRLRTYLANARLAADLEADAYHAHEPELSLAIALRARRLAARRRSKRARPIVIHDLHEFPPGSLADRFKKGIRRRWIKNLWMIVDYWLNRNVDYVFTANEIVRGYMLSLHPYLDGDVLYNAPSSGPTEQVRPESDRGSNTPLVLCHEGSLPFNRGLREMVQVVDQLRDDIKLIIVGEAFGAERIWLDSEIQKRDLAENIEITGWLAFEDVAQHIARADAGLITFRQSYNTRMAGPPNKLFNYMAAGLPVITVPLPETRRIVSENSCGIVCRDWSADALREAIKTLLFDRALLQTMSRSGTDAYQRFFRWELMEQRLFSAYAQLIGAPD